MMEKKPLKLYNVIFPIWILMFWPSPPVFLLTLFGNLAIDCLVVLLALLALKHPSKGTVLKRCWWKVWLLGFLSDIIGALWLAAGLFGAWALDADGTAGWVSDFAMAMTVNPFRHPMALVWTAVGTAVAGVCIYFFDKRAMKTCPLLTPREKHATALLLAVLTAPWLFLVPMY